MQSHHANHTPPALDGADSHAKVTTGAHAGAYGANDQKTPSEATAKRGNYKMGRVTVQGLRIAIEQPCGSIRSGKSEDGKEWSSRMAAHYGYFMGTQGADGDGIDCFVGPFPESEQVFVINQRNPGGGFDEHKVMVGFSSERHARGAYLDSYERGWRGLQSLVPISINQLRWWIKNGKKSIALSADSLPQEGPNPMNPKITWNEALPDSISLDQVLYQLRRMDGADGLLLDSVTMAEIMEDTDGVIALDALVVENAQLTRMAERLRAIMDRSGGAVKAPAVQVSEPFRARGVTNIAAIFELSDGQTVSIFFHNPDTAPNKLAPGDEMISWKWLLNKKDITIVVAPEKGQDLNPRLVASRIMKLAEKNSPAFQKANAKRSERMGNIEAIRGRIAEKEATLNELVAQVEAARLEKSQKTMQQEDANAATREEVKKWLEGSGYAVKDAAMSQYTKTIGERVMFVTAAKLMLSAMLLDSSKLGSAALNPIAPDFQAALIPASDGATQPAMDYAAGFEVITGFVEGREREAVTVVPAAEPAVVELTGNELGEFPDTPDGKTNLRSAAIKKLKSLEGVWVECPAISADAKIQIRNRGIKEFKRFTGNPLKLKAVAAIEQIIKNARQAKWEDNHKSQKRHAIGYYHIDSIIKIGDFVVKADLVVEKDDHGLLHYDYIIKSDETETASALLDDAVNVQHSPPDHKSGKDWVDKTIARADSACQVFDAAGGRMVLNLFMKVLDENGNWVPLPDDEVTEDEPSAELEYPPAPEGWALENSVPGMWVTYSKDGVRGVFYTGEKSPNPGAFMIITPDNKLHSSMHPSDGGGEGSVTWEDAFKRANEVADQFKAAPEPAPVEVYTFADASDEAISLFRIGAQNNAQFSTYKTAVSVEQSAISHGMAIRWEAVDSLPTFDDATGGLFGDGDQGHIRGDLSYNGTKLAQVYVREDGMAAFDYDKGLPEALGSDFDQFEDEYTGWNDAWDDVIYKLRNECDENGLGPKDPVAWEILIESLKKSGFTQQDEWDFVGGEGLQYVAIHVIPTKQAEASLMYWAGGDKDNWKYAVNIGELDGLIRADHKFDDDFSEDEMQPIVTELLTDAKTLQAWVEGEREKVKQERARKKQAQNPEPAPEEPADNELTRLNAALKAAPKDREAVTSDDPQAIEKLERKHYALQLRQEFMKKTNKLIKKGDDAGLIEMGFNQGTIETMKKPDFAGRIGFPDYELTNNNGVISTTRKRLEELKRRMSETKELTVTPDPAPTGTNAKDRAFFMSLIDGTHPNLDDPELVNNLEAAYQRNSEDAEMVSLFTQAINAYTTASLAETEGM